MPGEDEGSTRIDRHAKLLGHRIHSLKETGVTVTQEGMERGPTLEIAKPVLCIHRATKGDHVHVAHVAQSDLHSFARPRLIPRSKGHYAERSVSIDNVLHQGGVCNHFFSSGSKTLMNSPPFSG